MGNVITFPNTSLDEVPPKQQEQVSSSRVFDIINKVSESITSIVAVDSKAILIQEYGRHQLITKDVSRFTSYQVDKSDVRSDGGIVKVNQNGTTHTLKTLEAYNSYADKTAGAVFNILDFFNVSDKDEKTHEKAQIESAIAA